MLEARSVRRITRGGGGGGRQTKAQTNVANKNFYTGLVF